MTARFEMVGAEAPVCTDGVCAVPTQDEDSTDPQAGSED